MGIITLFVAYYQRFLFYEHTEPDYHTSGWVFFAIIMSTSCLKFLLFNVNFNNIKHLQTFAN